MSNHTTQLALPRPAQVPLTDGRFTQIPRALLAMLTPREYQLAAALLGYRWFDDSPIVPSVRRLAAEMGCSVRTVQRTAARLVELGIFVVEPRYRKDSDHGQTSNEYLPGPVLLAMLPRSGPAGVTPRATSSVIPPVTRRPAERYSGNQTNRTRRPERPDLRAPGRDYFATSDGVRLKPRT